jgi:hypothetical protein
VHRPGRVALDVFSHSYIPALPDEVYDEVRGRWLHLPYDCPEDVRMGDHMGSALM